MLPSTDIAKKYIITEGYGEDFLPQSTNFDSLKRTVVVAALFVDNFTVAGGYTISFNVKLEFKLLNSLYVLQNLSFISQFHFTPNNATK